VSTAGAGRAAWWVLVIALAAATIAAAAVGAWEFTVKNRQLAAPDQSADRQVVLQAATFDVATILSYKADTVEKDVNAAAAVMTGDFLNYYRNFTRQAVIPAAHDKGVNTTATVVRAGVESLSGHKASLLVFINQTTTSRDKPAPQLNSSSARVGMAKVNGTWLIDTFDPV